MRVRESEYGLVIEPENTKEINYLKDNFSLRLNGRGPDPRICLKQKTDEFGQFINDKYYLLIKPTLREDDAA